MEQSEMQQAFESQDKKQQQRMEELLGKLTDHMDRSFQPFKEATTERFAQHEGRIEKVEVDTEGLKIRVEDLEKNGPQEGEQAMLALAATEGALLKQTECNVFISNLMGTDGPLPEVQRMAILNKALKDTNLKPSLVEHMTQDKKLTAGTRITFAKPESVTTLINHVRKNNLKNPMNAPIYAKQEHSIELRRLRRQMTKAEQDIKAYYRNKKEQHKLGWHFKKHILRVDGVVVARRTSDCTVVWANDEFYNMVYNGGPMIMLD